ncbi:MAG: hypothetical protein DMG04_04765 [Acidobacteria bacterium]|nr:MAG: hypothetical protein DMG04_04765 [Acidobacteriota bacterium]PYQ83547.1 MAG: hypothetical protein DMG03_13355 [Acidobacteriota bacterium]PYQ84301.1 MAG: hypothetical protein DMG02_31555 [Acidobacteriota bacterium]PYR06208.1 MAG: hypothetical protein DMF99_26555 [Acidobacteriota bacterium]
MTLSRSDSRLQRWAVRAIAGFLVVYMLGAFGVPTLVPYLAVIIAVVADAVRLAIQGRGTNSPPPRDQRPKETIH